MMTSHTIQISQDDPVLDRQSGSEMDTNLCLGSEYNQIERDFEGFITNLSTNKVDKNAEELQDKAKSSSAIASTPMVNGENATHEFLAEPIIEDASGKESNDASEGGMKCEPKRLYEEKSEFDDEIKWVTEIPAHIKARNVEMMDNATSEYALLLRTKFVNDKEKLHSILVQSPLIRAAKGRSARLSRSLHRQDSAYI
jgi:hypothetical protein